jgi:hypothetical protein
MDGRVGGVAELLQHHIAPRVCSTDLFGPVDGTAHARAARGQHQPGTEGHQQATALEAHGLGHGQRQGNALGGGYIGQGNTRVAAGWFDELLPRPQDTALFGILDHGRSDATLDGIGGIAALDLGQHKGFRPCRHAIEAHQGGVSDGMGIVRIPMRHILILCFYPNRETSQARPSTPAHVI